MAREPVAAYLKNTEINSSVATVSVTKPIFSSGAQSSRVREAVETNYSDSLKVDDSHRQTLLGVTHSWTTLVSARAILQDLRDQLTAEKAAFEGSKAEQRVGLRSTIDLLNAEQEYQDTKISLAQKYHDEYIGRANLLEAIGVLTVEMIEPGMDVYQPERSFNHVMRSQILPWNRLVEAIDSFGEKPLGLQSSSRDPLGAGHVSGLDGMPAAPSWAELSRILAELPTRR
jgi:outer membrane protein